MTAAAQATADPPRNRISPDRTRAIARARYVRRHAAGLTLRTVGRAPIFEIGEILRQLVERRQQLGQSTDDIEYLAGITENHLAKIEAATRIPTLDLFLLIVKTMGGRVIIEWKKR